MRAINKASTKTDHPTMTTSCVQGCFLQDLQKTSLSIKSLIGLSALLFSMIIPNSWADQTLTVYSARQDHLIRPLLDQFEDQSGIEVELLTAKADLLLERIITEGRSTPADVLITVDAARLYRAIKANLLQPIDDPKISAMLPSHLMDDNRLWVGLSQRSRFIVYDPDQIDVSDISTYASLASRKLRKKICVRSSTNVYNQSFIASRIAHEGSDATYRWIRAFVKNMARIPKGGDRDQIAAVAKGECSVALVNDYYLFNMLHDGNTQQKHSAQKVRFVYPDQNGHGSHVNISGVGIIQNSESKEAALALIRFLLSSEAQKWYAQVNREMPVIEGIVSPDRIDQPPIKFDTLNLGALGQNNAAAVRMMERARWK